MPADLFRGFGVTYAIKLSPLKLGFGCQPLTQHNLLHHGAKAYSLTQSVWTTIPPPPAIVTKNEIDGVLLAMLFPSVQSTPSPRHT